MVSLPGFAVMVPSDEFCARALVLQAADYPHPVYIRTARPKAPLIHSAQTRFEIGKGIRLREGSDVTLAANGLLVFEALQAAELLAAEGISAGVIDLHTVKPLDEALLLEEAAKTGRIVVCEEHQIWGGLGSAVSTLVSRKHPCRMEFVAIQDTYAESGTPEGLFEKYGLSTPHIVRAAQRVLDGAPRAS
jgi:transketolase